MATLARRASRVGWQMVLSRPDSTAKTLRKKKSMRIGNTYTEGRDDDTNHFLLHGRLRDVRKDRYDIELPR